MYTHVDEKTRQIRLIRLRSFAESSSESAATSSWVFDAHCESLDSENLPSFTALSYVWGQFDPGRYRISLDGTILEITPNLQDALSTLSRLEDLSCQWLWIDAICINQSDIVEKGFQVRLMRDLYSRASRTIAYLGPEDYEGELGLSWLDRINVARSLSEPFAWLVDAATGSQYDLEWQSLNSLFGRQWWSRAWILQETIVSQNLLFVLGNKTITEETIINVFWFLRLCYHQISFSLLVRGFWINGWSEPFNALYKRFQLRGMYQKQQRLPLGNVISQRYDFCASDPRDYVYAIFGLVEQSGSLLASPNYELPVWQVYAALVESYIQVYGNLDIICLADSPRELQDLPSWAPDLLVRNKPDYPHLHEDSLWLMNLDAEDLLKRNREQQIDYVSDPTNEWDATFRASGATTPDVLFSEDLRTLTLRAVYIDAVDGVAGYQNIINNTILSTTRSTFISPNIQPKHSCSSYGTAKATKEAIWRTMLFDRLPCFDAQPAPSYVAALLAHACIVAEAGQGDRTWMSVWNAMKDFEIDGMSLKDWMCSGIDQATAEEEASEATNLYFESIKGREYDPTRLHKPVIPSCLHKLWGMQRRLFVTDGGYVGAAAAVSRPGDEVWIIHGCNIPVLLRRIDEEQWRVVGECYVHGFMYGEVMQDVEAGKRQAAKIILM